MLCHGQNRDVQLKRVGSDCAAHAVLRRQAAEQRSDHCPLLFAPLSSLHCPTVPKSRHESQQQRMGRLDSFRGYTQEVRGGTQVADRALQVLQQRDGHERRPVSKSPALLQKCAPAGQAVDESVVQQRRSRVGQSRRAGRAAGRHVCAYALQSCCRSGSRRSCLLLSLSQHRDITGNSFLVVT